MRSQLPSNIIKAVAHPLSYNTVNRETSASVLISRFDGLSRNLNAAKMSFRGLPMLRVLGRVKNRENKTPRIGRNRRIAKIKRRENKAIYSNTD